MGKTVEIDGLEFELETDILKRNVPYSKDYYYISYRELKYFHKLQRWLGIKFGPTVKKYSMTEVPPFNRTIYIPDTCNVEGVITNYHEVIETDKRSQKIEFILD